MDIVWLVGLLTPYLPFLMGLGQKGSALPLTVWKMGHSNH
jgi:hypothetical protein